MDDFKDLLFTVELMRLVQGAKEAPDKEQGDYINKIIGECYAHEMVKAMNGSPSVRIVCAVPRAFSFVYNHEDFKDVHDKLTAILNAAICECLNDLEAAEKKDKD